MLEVQDSKHSSCKGSLCEGSFKTLSVHPAVNGYPTLFTPGEGENHEEVE